MNNDQISLVFFSHVLRIYYFFFTADILFATEEKAACVDLQEQRECLWVAEDHIWEFIQKN